MTNYAGESIAATLKAARDAKGLSQRELARLSGVPQSHISKIEANAVDLRISSLAALSHALDLDLVLAPRLALPAVRAMIGTFSGSRVSDESVSRPAYSLDDEADDHG